jgi:hypothetical protein
MLSICKAFEREIIPDRPADLVVLRREDFAQASAAGLDVEVVLRRYPYLDSDHDLFARRHGRWHITHVTALAEDRWTWSGGGVRILGRVGEPSVGDDLYGSSQARRYLKRTPDAAEAARLDACLAEHAAMIDACERVLALHALSGATGKALAAPPVGRRLTREERAEARP